MSLTKYLTRYSTPYLTEEGVADLLVQALRNAQPYRPPHPNIVYVTEAVRPCLRQAYFNRLYPSPPTIAAIVGEYLHNILEEAFARLGLKTEVGLAVDLGEFKLAGRADAVLENDEGNVEDVVEIKTVGKLPERPESTHVRQLQVYLELLEAPKGTLLYIDRNRGHAKLFTIRPDPGALELAKENARILWEALNSHTPPNPRQGAWCVFCPHRRRCWAADRSVAV